MTIVDAKKRPRSHAAQLGDSDEPIAREALDNISNSAEGDVELESWDAKRCCLRMGSTSEREVGSAPQGSTEDCVLQIMGGLGNATPMSVVCNQLCALAS